MVAISGSIILILVAVIGVFYRMKEKEHRINQEEQKKMQKDERSAIIGKINDLSKQQKESVDQLSSVVETVKETVFNLKIIVEVIRDSRGLCL